VSDQSSSAPIRLPIACSVRDAAAPIGISRSSFYLLIARGEIPIAKVGNRTLILDDDLRAYLARQRVVVERLATE
jgi:excisionase family DNA binding protein